MAQFGRDWFDRMVHEEMSQLLEHFSGAKPPSVRFAPAIWEPPIDMYETPDAVVIVVELAGVSEDNVEIVIDRSSFTVRGNRKRTEQLAEKRAYHRMEIPSGPFRRTVSVPVAVEPSGVKATCERGFVRVVLPKVKSTRIKAVDEGSR